MIIQEIIIDSEPRSLGLLFEESENKISVYLDDFNYPFTTVDIDTPYLEILRIVEQKHYEGV